MICIHSVRATEQMPDYLYYKGKKLTLHTGWGHPSPLETYYSQNNIKYPFTMLHTANYRGHVAIWEIKDEKLFLKEIQIEDKKYNPSEFNVRSKTDAAANKSNIFADWFSGIISCQDKKESYYFHVRNGVLVNTQILRKKDYNRIENISEKDSSNTKLMEKYLILVLNRNYIAYYFRLHGNDTIIYDDKGGYFTGNSGLSPLLLYYSNDHMKWLFNWENFEKNGAPNCKWIIEDNKLYLLEIYLHSGTGFFSIDKDSVDLEIIFNDKVKNKKVFGDWISGIYVISHGENVEDEYLSGYYTFKPSAYTYMRISNGIVGEMYTVSSDFDFRNMPADTEPGLKKMIEEINK